MAFLRSVDERTLDGQGLAITLTLRHCPPTREAWARLVKAWTMRQQRAGMIRLHWVMEFQRRGVPHLHAAIWYRPDRVKPVDPLTSATVSPAMVHSDMRQAPDVARQAGERAVADWIDLAAEYEAGPKGQQVRPIVGPVGWFMYLAKHCGRGRDHYQRQQESQPEAWDGSPRVWGHWGAWTLEEPAVGRVTERQWYSLRRMVRRQRIARARAGIASSWSELQAAWPMFTREQLRAAPIAVLGTSGPALRVRLRQLQGARRMLWCPDAKLSSVRGVSEWVTQQEQADLMRAVQAG